MGTGAAFKVLQMNRAFFKDAQYNMELVTVLKNFKASIDSKVENSRQDNGSRTDNYSQVVNSNLPASFNLIVPISKVALQKRLKWKSLQMWTGVIFDCPFAPLVQK